MTRETAGSVAVITGASSGIARATALELASRGAAVVLAARSADSLDEAARECRDAGGRASAVPTDATDEQAVAALADRAVRDFGRIDVWINAAAVIAYGEFEQTPSDVYRTVGAFAPVIELSHALAPHLFNRVVPTVMRRVAFGPEDPAPSPGNVFEPLPEWNQVEGHWRWRPMSRAR